MRPSAACRPPAAHAPAGTTPPATRAAPLRRAPAPPGARPSRASSRRSRRRRGSRSSSTRRPRHAPARGHDPLGGLLARPVRHRAREHHRLARQGPLRRRRPLLAEAQPELGAGRRSGSACAPRRAARGSPSPSSRRSPGVSSISSYGRLQQRVDVAEAHREVAAGDLADLLDPQREQHARERPLLRGLDRSRSGCARRSRQSPRARRAAPRQPVEVGCGSHQLALLQRRHLLLAEAVDVHRAARDEVLEQLPRALGAVAVGALREHRPLRLDRLGVAERAAPRRARARGRPFCSTTCGAGETTCGITSPARITITSSPCADVLADDVLLVVQRR